MQDEEAVELAYRYLYLDGLASLSVEKLARRALPADWPVNSRLCFVGYAYANLEFPKPFDTMFLVNTDECVSDSERDCLNFRPHHLATGIAAPSRILAATQQFGVPEKRISGGWKLICLIDFPAGVPEMIETLPVVDSWFVSRQCVCLCSYATWAALIDKEPC
jgi:hypothetical protein